MGRQLGMWVGLRMGRLVGMKVVGIPVGWWVGMYVGG